MEDYRSKSYGGDNKGMEIQRYQGGGGGEIVPYGSSSVQHTQQMGNTADLKFKKAKSGGSSSKIWCFSDPELQRKKRVASYKVYAVEGKMKGGFRKSFRWVKDRYTKVVYGWW